MPNFKGGKNFKKGKKQRNDFQEKKQVIKRDPDDGQEYAQVVSAKGNGRFELKCCDGGGTRLGIIRGTMRKRVWVNRSDLVLICKWSGMTDDTKCSIIHKYSEDEARRLIKEGELPENFKLNLDELEEDNSDDDYFTGQPTDSSSEEEEEEEEEEVTKVVKDVDIDDI